MVDTITERLVAYTQAFSLAEMTAPVTNAAVDHLFDTIACAVAGANSQPARIVADLARLVTYDNGRGATLFGYGVNTAPEIAALGNAMMVRTYDWNDGLEMRGGGHASDMISGMLAAGEVAHASGMDVLLAITLAYEVLGGLGYDIRLSEKGFDQGTFKNVAVALAVGKLWGLSADQLANAASLALVPNLPLGVSRWGELSMMKGCATAFSTRNGVFAAMLAQRGFTSAPEPFAGIRGMHHVTGPFDVYLPVSPLARCIQFTEIKALPAEMNVQSLLALVPAIRAWTSLEDIESIDVVIASELVVHLADEPKYDPHTRETADHSLPYMLAVALVDGTLTLDSFSAQRIADPALRPLMRKFHVTGSEQYHEMRHAQIQAATGESPPRPAKITIRTRSGRVLEEEVLYHKGHTRNPLTRDDLNAKFDAACTGVVEDPAQREQIRAAWWNVERAGDIGDPIRTLLDFKQRAPARV